MRLMPTPPTSILQSAGSSITAQRSALKDEELKPRWTPTVFPSLWKLSSFNFWTDREILIIMHYKMRKIHREEENKGSKKEKKNVTDREERGADGTLSVLTEWHHITTKFNLISTKLRQIHLDMASEGSRGTRWVFLSP